MAHFKYQGVLGTFVLITIFLALIILALTFWPNEEEQLNFDFPGALPTTYLKLLDWPPQVQVINTEFSCLEAGNVSETAGRTELKNIEGRNFCVTELVQGAAGSIYTQYAYAFAHNDETVILTFSTRAPQCGNYPEPQMTECAEERASFSIDHFISQIVEEAD